MKNKELKNLLRSKAEAVEINVDTTEILSKVERVPCSPVRKKSFSVWIPALCGALVACLMMVLIPWGALGGGNDGGLTIGKAERIVSKEMLALGNIVSESDSSVSAVRLAKKSGGADYQKIAEDVNYYLLTGDALVSSEGISVVYTRNTDPKYADYDYKMEVTYSDKAMYGVDYVAYYDEDERGNGKTALVGVFVVNGNAYPLEGRKETERDEVEVELILRLGADSYVSVSNEAEKGENEYEYKFVEGGVVVKGVSLELSTENGKKETEIEITENGVTTAYEFEYKAETIECEYEKGNTEYEMTVFIHDTYYLYLFDDGTKIKLHK